MPNRENPKRRACGTALCALLVLTLSLSWSEAATTSPGGESRIMQGVLAGTSRKAGLLSLQVGAKTELIHYGSETTGLDEVKIGDNVVLHYQGEGKQRLALSLDPLLPQLPAGVKEIAPEELLALVNSPSPQEYLLVDCRPAEFYAETHLPTAVSIPWTETAARKTARLPGNRNSLLIFYCLGPTCLLGPNSAELAVQAGYSNVRVMFGELSEWQELGGKLYSADDYIASGNIILVDLRNRREVQAGHLPGATQLTLAELPEAQFDFPPRKSAPVVVYGDAEETAKAVALIKGWGYRQVTEVSGGYAGWVERGNPVETAGAATTIDWRRQPEPGEITLVDFNRAVAARAPDTLIIDVRTAAEAAAGKIDNSFNIPLNELLGRMAEIPEDKELILHCTTGTRAKMAWDYLKQHRARVRYLQAKVICRNGTCRVRP